MCVLLTASVPSDTHRPVHGPHLPLRRVLPPAPRRGVLRRVEREEPTRARCRSDGPGQDRD